LVTDMLARSFSSLFSFSFFFYCLFGKNVTFLFSDHFWCEKSVLSVVKRKEEGHFYGAAEWNHSIQTSFSLFSGFIFSYYYTIAFSTVVLLNALLFFYAINSMS